MSDNRRVYRTIRQAIVQLYPGEIFNSLPGCNFCFCGRFW